MYSEIFLLTKTDKHDIILKYYLKTGCSAGGSALDWGSRGRRFKSCHSDHVEAKESSASTFFMQKKSSARFLASPFHKKSRSVRLFGCKRPHNDSLSLPTFCEFKFSI